MADCRAFLRAGAHTPPSRVGIFRAFHPRPIFVGRTLRSDIQLGPSGALAPDVFWVPRTPLLRVGTLSSASAGGVPHPRLLRVGCFASSTKIFLRRKHSSAQQFLSAASPHFLGPLHPRRFAQPKQMTRLLVRREPQVVHPKQHHARRPAFFFERRLARECEVRHLVIQPGTHVRPPQKFRRLLPVQR